MRYLRGHMSKFLGLVETKLEQKTTSADADKRKKNKAKVKAKLKAKKQKKLDFIEQAKSDLKIDPSNKDHEIFLAALIGDEKAVNAYAENGRLNILTPTGVSLLECAAMNNQTGIIKILLNANAKKNRPKYIHLIQQAFVAAAGYGSLEAAQLLSAEGADINETNNQKYTALKLAAQNGHEHVVSWLVTSPKIKLNLSGGGDSSAHGKSNDELEHSQTSALMLAASHNQAAVVTALLEAGAARDLVTDEDTQRTPFLQAVYLCSIDAINAFIDFGIELLEAAKAINLIYKMHQELIHNASLTIDKLNKISTLVASAFADLLNEIVTKDDLCEVLPLLITAKQFNLVQQIIAKLRKEFADRKSSKGAQSDLDTALLLAAGYGDNTLIQQLLSLGANPYARERQGFTPLAVAAINNKPQAVILLLEHDKEINAGINSEYKDNMDVWLHKFDPDEFGYIYENEGKNYTDGMTALMLAAQEGSTDAVTTLLKAGADSKKKSNRGLTALEYAEKHQQSACIKILGERALEEKLYAILGYPDEQSTVTQPAIAVLIKYLFALQAKIGEHSFQLPSKYFFKIIPAEAHYLKAITFNYSDVKNVLGEGTKLTLLELLKQIWEHSKENEQFKAVPAETKVTHYEYAPYVKPQTVISANLEAQIKQLLIRIDRVITTFEKENSGDHWFFSRRLSAIKDNISYTEATKNTLSELLNLVIEARDNLTAYLQTSKPESKASQTEISQKRYQEACTKKAAEQEALLKQKADNEEKETKDKSEARTAYLAKMAAAKAEAAEKAKHERPALKSLSNSPRWETKTSASDRDRDNKSHHRFFKPKKPRPFILGEADKNQWLKNTAFNDAKNKLKKLLALKDALASNHYKEIYRDALLFVCAQVMESYKSLRLDNFVSSATANHFRNAIFHCHGLTPATLEETVAFASLFNKKLSDHDEENDEKSEHTAALLKTISEYKIDGDKKHVTVQWQNGLNNLRLYKKLDDNISADWKFVLEQAELLTLTRMHAYGYAKNIRVVDIETLDWNNLDRKAILTKINKLGAVERHRGTAMLTKQEKRELRGKFRDAQAQIAACLPISSEKTGGKEEFKQLTY